MGGNMGYKIVRDRQREFCEKHGVSGRWRISPDPLAALTRKVGEEYLEFVENHDPTELYDMLDALIELMQVADPNDVGHMNSVIKRAEQGTFRAHLEWDPVPDAPGRQFAQDGTLISHES